MDWTEHITIRKHHKHTNATTQSTHTHEHQTNHAQTSKHKKSSIHILEITNHKTFHTIKTIYLTNTKHPRPNTDNTQPTRQAPTITTNNEYITHKHTQSAQPKPTKQPTPLKHQQHPPFPNTLKQAQQQRTHTGKTQHKHKQRQTQITRNNKKQTTPTNTHQRKQTQQQTARSKQTTNNKQQTQTHNYKTTTNTKKQHPHKQTIKQSSKQANKQTNTNKQYKQQRQ